MPEGRRRKELWLSLAGLLVFIGMLLIAWPFVMRTGSSPAEKTARLGGSSTSSVALRTSRVARPSSAAAETPSVSLGGSRTESAAVTPADMTSATASGRAPARVKPRLSAPHRAASPAGPLLAAYRGLGSWVDIYDDKAWGNPTAAVSDMARRGVRTLYIETSNSRSSFALKDSRALVSFVREAHAHSMRVVAWYLPDMRRPSTDYARIVQAIGFRTPDGQKFDSFALDIESGAIKSEKARNAALASLSTRIRALVGTSYALGAIIPSPTGLAKKMGYWDAFPYSSIACTYDVFLPMSYYTYHGKGGPAAYADTLSNVSILRAQKGCAKTPIHLIGGISEDSSAPEVRTFVRAALETRCIGASLYGWAGTTGGDWRELSAIKR